MFGKVRLCGEWSGERIGEEVENGCLERVEGLCGERRGFVWRSVLGRETSKMESGSLESGRSSGKVDSKNGVLVCGE